MLGRLLDILDSDGKSRLGPSDGAWTNGGGPEGWW